MSYLDFDHDLESESLSAGNADRRMRQRRRRALLTAAPKKAFPWGLLVQGIMVFSVVALATLLFDWLQPLELVIVFAATVGSMAFVYFALHDRVNRLVQGGAAILLGPVSGGLAVAIAGASLASLHQFPSTHVFTDRDVASVETRVNLLRSTQSHRLKRALLIEAIGTSDSEYWRRRWEDQLAEVASTETAEPSVERAAGKATPHPVVIASGPFDDREIPESSPESARPAETDVNDLDSIEQGLKLEPPDDPSVSAGAAAWSATPRPVDAASHDLPSSDNVLSQVIEFQKSGRFAAAESYLRRLIQEEPRTNWQCDYEQLYVDHWVDWGNAHTDLDQRHVCYMKALRTARGFRRDSSVLSAMLVRLERELQSQPKLLPAACQLRVHSVESDQQELIVELSVLSPDGEYLHDLVAKDFRIRCGKSDVQGVKLTTGDSRSRPLRRNVVALIDLSVSDPIISEARVDAARRFLDELPADTSRLMLALADHIEISGWETDQCPDTRLISAMPRSTSAPALRGAVAKALGLLSDRSGSKDLVIFSLGQEQPEPYLTTTSLIQRATRDEVRVHAVVEAPSRPSARRLMADLTQATRGHFQSITPGTSETASQSVARYFPQGNFVVHVPLESDDFRDVRLTVGRGATLLHTNLDAPAELAL